VISATTALARSEPLILLGIVAAALAVSAVNPHDYLTWWLEVAPVLIVAPLLIATAKTFPLTLLVYRLIAVHALVLILGGHYTYAEVPLGFWVQDAFDLARNHYDRLGHFIQGFVPAIVAREILLRRSPLLAGKWLFFIVCSICLAVSACYEFIEWWTALLGGGSAEAFLGTQGDVWDTQWDMFLALNGAIAAQLLLARVHDRQLAALVRFPLPAGEG
jgi:putative membrane protein